MIVSAKWGHIRALAGAGVAVGSYCKAAGSLCHDYTVPARQMECQMISRAHRFLRLRMTIRFVTQLRVGDLLAGVKG